MVKISTVSPVEAQTNSITPIQIFWFHCIGCNLEEWKAVTLMVPCLCLLLLPSASPYMPLS